MDERVNLMSKVRLYQKKSTNDALAANYDFAFDFKDFIKIL